MDKQLPRIRSVVALESLKLIRLYEEQQEYGDRELIRMLNQYERESRHRSAEEREQASLHGKRLQSIELSRD